MNPVVGAVGAVTWARLPRAARSASARVEKVDEVGTPYVVADARARLTHKTAPTTTMMGAARRVCDRRVSAASR